MEIGGHLTVGLAPNVVLSHQMFELYNHILHKTSAKHQQKHQQSNNGNCLLSKNIFVITSSVENVVEIEGDWWVLKYKYMLKIIGIIVLHTNESEVINYGMHKQTQQENKQKAKMSMR